MNRDNTLMNALSAWTVGLRCPHCGTYAGASAEVTAGGGIGANMLVGGSFRTVELQPFTVQEQTGINLAAGIAEIELHFVR
jgi:hypothetical protein